MDYEVQRNVSKSIKFRKLVPAGTSGTLTAELVAHGYVTGVNVRFAAGESGTLQIRPIIMLPGEIAVDLFSYAENGDKYVTGDDESVPAVVQQEIERKTKILIDYNNTGAAESFVNVDVEVTYFEIREPANVIGPVGKRRWF